MLSIFFFFKHTHACWVTRALGGCNSFSSYLLTSSWFFALRKVMKEKHIGFYFWIAEQIISYVIFPILIISQSTTLVLKQELSLLTCVSLLCHKIQILQNPIKNFNVHFNLSWIYITHIHVPHRASQNCRTQKALDTAMSQHHIW